MTDMLPYAIVPDGLRLAIRVTPRAHRDGLDGVEPGADGRPQLRIRLRAAPADGAANATLIDLVRAETGLRRSAIQLTAGATGRSKLLFLAGDPAKLRAMVDAWIARAAAG